MPAAHHKLKAHQWNECVPVSTLRLERLFLYLQCRLGARCPCPIRGDAKRNEVCLLCRGACSGLHAHQLFELQQLQISLLSHIPSYVSVSCQMT